jgi:hypothetical protein
MIASLSRHARLESAVWYNAMYVSISFGKLAGRQVQWMNTDVRVPPTHNLHHHPTQCAQAAIACAGQAVVRQMSSSVPLSGSWGKVGFAGTQ